MPHARRSHTLPWHAARQNTHGITGVVNSQSTSFVQCPLRGFACMPNARNALTHDACVHCDEPGSQRFSKWASASMGVDAPDSDRNPLETRIIEQPTRTHACTGLAHLRRTSNAFPTHVLRRRAEGLFMRRLCRPRNRHRTLGAACLIIRLNPFAERHGARGHCRPRNCREEEIR